MYHIVGNISDFSYKYLKKLDVLDAFRTAAPISPRAIVKNQGKMPKRIRSARIVKDTEPEW